MSASKDRKEKVAVIGTGNYGTAIGKRLIEYGFLPIFGSRTPNFSYLQECLNTSEASFEVVGINEAVHRSETFIFLAIEPKNYQNFVTELLNESKEIDYNDTTVVDLKKTKILIEVSNWNDNQNEQKTQVSNAEKLVDLIEKKSEDENYGAMRSNLLRVVKGIL
jgi:predicted dinucleotide-binding enzyme